MYIAHATFHYYRGSESGITRGRFLLLLQPNIYKQFGAPADGKPIGTMLDIGPAILIALGVPS
jgi:hypothetical protein